MPVRRSDSLRSADSSQRRVSFNRAVHVKRIPRGQAPPAPALAVDQEGRLLPLPVRREKAPRSALELAREARKVLQQANSVSCTASSPSGVPIRPPRTPKTPPPSEEEFRSRTLPYRRAHRGRIVVDLGNSSSTSGGESSLERKGRSKNRQNKQLSPIIETGYNNNSYHHNNNYNPPPPLNSDTDYLNTQSDSATMLHSRHKSPAPTAIHQTTTIQQTTTSSNVTNGPRRSVNVLMRQLQKDSEQSHLNTRVSPQVLHTPDNEICHNNNRPFSYIKPPLDSPAGNEVIYAQVVVSGQGSGVNKQTVHTSVKPPPSDEDEGLEIDAAYRPRHTNGYSVNLRNERNGSSAAATSSSRLINEGNSSYDKDVLLDSRLKSSSKFHSGGYNNSSNNYISSNNNNLKKKDLCIDSDSSYTKQRDLFDSGIENDNPPLLRHQQQQQHESSKIESDGLTAKIVVNGGYNQSRVQQASTNVTRVNLNGRRIHDSTTGATNVPNGRSSSSNNTTERYYYSGDRRSQSPAMASARLVQQAADRSRDLPASSVLIRHWTNSSQDKRSNGSSSNTYQRKPRRRLEMEEDTDQDQRAREKQPLVNNKVVAEKKKRKMKMKNPFARDKKSPPPIREDQVTTRYSEYKGSNLHLKRTGSDSSRETPASHGPSDTDQGPWDEVDTATDYSRHRILDRSSSNPVHRQQQQRGPAPRGPSPVVRKSSGESASSLARSEPAINTRASKSSGGAASWFKSLDRLTFRTNKANKAAAAAAADTKKKEEAKNQKNLRFFGDTDQESVISTAHHHHHASAPAPQRQYRSNQNSRYQTSLGGRSSSSGARRGVQLRQSRQSASPNSSEDSENATTEGDSSLQSQRSVYLHAAAVGDIPGPGGPRRAISREELSSTSGRLQPQTRTLSRSISVLAPWRPRHYKNEAPEIHYDNESTATLRPNSATKPPRAPRSKMSAQSMESLHGSGSSPERARSTSRHRSSKAPAPQPPSSKSSNRMQQQQHHHRSGGTAVSRSASMPKDSRLAGWFRRKKLGSKETNTNNL